MIGKIKTYFTKSSDNIEITKTVEPISATEVKTVTAYIGKDKQLYRTLEGMEIADQHYELRLIENKYNVVLNALYEAKSRHRDLGIENIEAAIRTIRDNHGIDYIYAALKIHKEEMALIRKYKIEGKNKN
jgi:hypothetical protein